MSRCKADGRRKTERESTFPIPAWLSKLCRPETYLRWLSRKAATHARRDRKRWKSPASISAYKHAIHHAVLSSKGRDAYTGARLEWSLISTYRNDSSKQHGGSYKRRFAAMPSVDHVFSIGDEPAFVICSWRCNDAKSDLSREEFISLCRQVLKNLTRSKSK